MSGFLTLCDRAHFAYLSAQQREPESAACIDEALELPARGVRSGGFQSGAKLAQREPAAQPKAAQ